MCNKPSNHIYNTSLHNNMEIIVGKQPLYMQDRRKWVRETEIRLGQESAEI
jgi:hypothetical protein